MEKKSKLEVKNIRKLYQGDEILKDISFALESGEFLSILAPSGAGKTTLLNIIAGYEKCDGGKVFKDGKDITGTMGNFGYMQQQDLLLPWLTTLDNATLALKLKGVNKKVAQETAKKYFKTFGIGGYEDNFPAELSGGMRQRLALLRTYLMGSDTILFDEPFSKLDAITRENLRNWFKGILKEVGITSILVTHDIEEAIELSDRILILSNQPVEIIKEIRVSEKDRDEEFIALKKVILGYFTKE